MGPGVTKDTDYAATGKVIASRIARALAHAKDRQRLQFHPKERICPNCRWASRMIAARLNLPSPSMSIGHSYLALAPSLVMIVSPPPGDFSVLSKRAAHGRGESRRLAHRQLRRRCQHPFHLNRQP